MSGRTRYFDYRKGIPWGRGTSAFDRKLHWMQLRIRGPCRVFATGLRGPSTRDTSCTRYTGRTRWRFRSFQSCQGSGNRRELLKNPIITIVACSMKSSNAVARKRLDFRVIAVFDEFRLYLLNFPFLFGICWSIWIIRENQTTLIITLTLKWII